MGKGISIRQFNEIFRRSNQDGEVTIKSNQGELYLHIRDFNKEIVSGRKNGLNSKTIPHGINTSVSTDIYYVIHLYFDIEVHGEACILFI